MTEVQRGRNTWAVTQKRGQLWSVGLQETGEPVSERYGKINLRQFCLFLPNPYSCFFFYLLLILCRISSSVLKKRGVKGQTCLVTHLKGKRFNVSPLYMFAVGFWRMVFTILRKFPLISSVLITFFFFNHKQGLHFKCFLSIFCNDHKFFLF